MQGMPGMQSLQGMQGMMQQQQQQQQQPGGMQAAAMNFQLQALQALQQQQQQQQQQSAQPGLSLQGMLSGARPPLLAAQPPGQQPQMLLGGMQGKLSLGGAGGGAGGPATGTLLPAGAPGSLAAKPMLAPLKGGGGANGSGEEVVGEEGRRVERLRLLRSIEEKD